MNEKEVQKWAGSNSGNKYFMVRNDKGKDSRKEEHEKDKKKKPKKRRRFTSTCTSSRSSSRSRSRLSRSQSDASSASRRTMTWRTIIDLVNETMQTMHKCAAPAKTEQLDELLADELLAFAARESLLRLQLQQVWLVFGMQHDQSELLLEKKHVYRRPRWSQNISGRCKPLCPQTILRSVCKASHWN